MNTLLASRSTVILDGSTVPDRHLVGGKAWSIAHMMHLGLRVPPAFVVTAPMNAKYQAEGKLWPALVDEIREGIAHLERSSGRSFGGRSHPLLVSVRSGAAVSMPGMMDTVLNLGMNDQVEVALAQECQDAMFASDTHRRFLQLFSSVVLGTEVHEGARANPQMIARQLRADGRPVPEEPFEQLLSAVEAVFQSWNSRRARRYREHHNIPHDLGTAVTIQAMVFGNLNQRSGTGVLFSRNPLTGERVPYGEFLRKAQGEDVVSGKMTPQPLDAMKQDMGSVHAELLRASALLEATAGEVQDIEFTVEDGTLFILQSRAAKLAPLAATRTAVDFVAEGRVKADVALKRVSSGRLRQLLAPTLAVETTPVEALARGEGACPGVGIGLVVTDADAAEERIRKGERVVLARPTTSPNDLHGMIGAAAVITEEGGSTSHAAVVSRALGVPCVVGCGTGSLASIAGQVVTVDGQGGAVFSGELPVQRPDERQDVVLKQLLAWAAELSPLKVLPLSHAEAESALDLSRDEEACDEATIDAALERLLKVTPARGAKGGAISSDAGVRAALRHGLQFIAAEPVLPPLVAAVHVRLETASSSRQG